MGQVKVGAAIGASFRFIGEAWTKAWGIMLISVWFAATLEAIELLKPGWALASFLGLIAALFITTAAAGALYRLRSRRATTRGTAPTPPIRRDCSGTLWSGASLAPASWSASSSA